MVMNAPQQPGKTRPVIAMKPDAPSGPATPPPAPLPATPVKPAPNADPRRTQRNQASRLSPTSAVAAPSLRLYGPIRARVYRWFETPTGRRRSIPVVAVLSGIAITGSVLLIRGRDTSYEPPTISEDTVVVTTGQPNDDDSSTSESAADAVGDPEYIDSIVQVMVIEGGMPCQSGSGTVVGDGTLVLTNYHVIEEGGDCRVDAIEIWTSESPSSDPRPTHDARVVVDDKIADLTILRLTPKGGVTDQLVPLEFGDDPAFGDDLVIVGFPNIGGTSITISKGIVSGFTLDSGVRWIKTDAAIAGGSSGGAALSGKRRLVGIPTMASQGANGEIVDCRPVADTNGDGEIDEADACVPIGGFFNLLSPVSLARALIARVDS